MHNLGAMNAKDFVLDVKLVAVMYAVTAIGDEEGERSSSSGVVVSDNVNKGKRRGV